jgi:peroxiredoxin
VNHRQEGPWRYYFPGGAKQAEGSWFHDKQIGSWSWWYGDGKPQYQGSYLEGGLRDGVWKAWHREGPLASEGAYRLDRQDGAWLYGHPSGARYAAGSFDLGVKHGWWLKQTPEGAPQECGLYLKGLKVGPWATWKDGTPQVEDLGAPTGFTAGWEGSDYVLRGGGGTARLHYDANGVLATQEIAFDGRSLTALPGERTAFAIPLPVEKAPVPAVTAPVAPAAAPLTTVVSPVPTSVPIAASTAAQIEAPSSGLSPTPVIPTVLAEGDLAHSAQLIKAYTSGRDPFGNAEYDFGASQGDPAGSKLVGKKLPQTRFLSTTGSVVDVTRSGKPVVLCVMRGFSGQVCIYCASQTTAIANSHARFTAAGADVVVIYPGPSEAVPAFIQAVQTLRKDPPPMAIGLDVSLLLVRGLGIEENLAKPTSLIINPDGTIVYAYVGASMADRPSVEDLLRALAKVQK